MKIGIITDVHNNVIALNSILKLFEEKECDEILCCGDIIGIGPFPEETVQRIKSLTNIKCVLGNHEKYLINGIKKPYPDGMDETEALHHEWEHSLLSDDSKQYIKQLPYILHLDRGNLKLAVVHYSISEDNRYINFKPNPDITDCEKMFSNINADIILYGHDHRGSIVYGNDKIYINCGSLGCTSTNEGIAQGGILTIDQQKPAFQKVFAEYDLKRVLEEVDSIKYPAYEDIKKFFYGVK
ncbi:metallophosphoesterase family protein [Clostridium manihotivorum]|uniref:Metallophosphoesterase n=1 Tax=Clostridium manihotivorum TaxID=2320868 RepID=A0A3R5QV58_9CLOT|nr:metallophosphoesterase family protein [Clostridium manihotivorum]QAA33023.1 metallophosphoesterase [Clostridium manihotivorum]